MKEKFEEYQYAGSETKEKISMQGMKLRRN